jgi:hypothetical protein
MLPLSISARGSLSCRLHVLGKLWPLPRIRREASTCDSIVFENPVINPGYHLKAALHNPVAKTLPRPGLGFHNTLVSTC